MKVIMGEGRYLYLVSFLDLFRVTCSTLTVLRSITLPRMTLRVHLYVLLFFITDRMNVKSLRLNWYSV